MIFHDLCVLRYSDKNIVDSADGFGDFNAYTSNDTVPTPSVEFDVSIQILLKAVMNYVATSSSRYGTGV